MQPGIVRLFFIILPKVAQFVYTQMTGNMLLITPQRLEMYIHQRLAVHTFLIGSPE